MTLLFVCKHKHVDFTVWWATIIYKIVEVGFKELNPRQRVYVEIPKPSRVELKCNLSDTREGFGIST
jgi:hypothetical protein